MHTEEPTGHDTNHLGDLLMELRKAGKDPDTALLERVRACGKLVVQPLIDMAIDEDLNNADEDSPEVWAPLHAITLLGELRAAEAVAPLIPLLESDDDWITSILPETFGLIGEPAFQPLREYLFDRGHDLWGRVYAAEALGKIGTYHPETRSQIIDSLVPRLDPSESREPDDETVNSFVISALLDLKATEAAPAIFRAFEEDRVDTSVVDLNSVMQGLDIPDDSVPGPPAKKAGVRLRLRCTSCGYERDHYLDKVYCDVPTYERRSKGEKTPYSEFILPERIACPKCNAVGQYEMSALAYAALTAELLKHVVSIEGGVFGEGVADQRSRLIFRHFTLEDGREMHPLVARDTYRSKVEAEPNRSDLRIRYGRILAFLGYREEAIEQYRRAIELGPAPAEVYLEMGYLLRGAGEVEEAREMFDRAIAVSGASTLPHESSNELVRRARQGLQDSRHIETVDPFETDDIPASPQRQPAFGSRAGTASPQPFRLMTPKIGRNAPCPCGSGKKYKKCCGR